MYGGAGKGPHARHLNSQPSPQGYPKISYTVRLAEYRSCSISDRRPSATSFLHPAFHQATSAVMLCSVLVWDRLVGLVVKASASRVAGLGSNPAFGVNGVCFFFLDRVMPFDLKSGNPVATLSGTWRCRVSAGSGWPCGSIL